MASMASSDPARGEVWLLNLSPTKGHEQEGQRPALVISVDAFNQGPADLIVVLHEGTVAAVGTHAELMAAGGLYAELYALQAASYR